MIKIIAIDLDDTLLTTYKIISKENEQAIKKASSNGVKVVITTGRPYFRIVTFLKQLGLYNSDSFVISYNGCMISDGLGQKIIKQELLNNKDIKTIASVFDDLGLHYNVYYNKNIYSIDVLDFIKKQAVFKNVDFDICSKDFISNLVYSNKIIACDYEKKINDVRSSIEKRLKGKYNILRSNPNYLEVLSINANKGKALKTIMDLLNINPSEAMAIGDEENDLSMYDYVDYKIAMGNASDVLKQNATFITLQQNDNGVQYAIDKFYNNFN